MQKPEQSLLTDLPFFLCPVCPGQALQQWCLEGITESNQKVLSLVLDHCPQCSGMWLTSDRLFMLRSVPTEFLQHYIPFRYENFVVCCASCGLQMSRRATHCQHCQHINTIVCSQCYQSMDTQFVGGLQQDRCFNDHGFWLDHLAWIQIWDLSERYFKTSTFREPSDRIKWFLKTHRKPSRQLQKKLQKQSAREISLRKRQGFASDVTVTELDAAQAAWGSLGVAGFLGKGVLRISWNLFRILARLR